MTALSGGQAARVGLAALLLSRYDILLLDEPTNDLDLDGLDRLERFVVQLRTGMVVVSHTANSWPDASAPWWTWTWPSSGWVCTAAATGLAGRAGAGAPACP